MTRRFQRLPAALLALLVQAFIIAALVQTQGQRWTEGDHAPGLIFIQPIHLSQPDQMPAAASRKPDPRVRMPPAGIAAAQHETSAAEDQQSLPPQTEATSAITVPSTDWRSAMADAARHVVEQDAARTTHGVPLDSRPQVLEMPARIADDAPTPEDLATLQNRFGSGSVCGHTELALAEHFDPWAQHRPMVSGTCGGKGRRAASAVNLDVTKPGYLRQPLPVPPAPPQKSAAH